MEKPKLARPLHAVIHAEAKDWEPVSLRGRRATPSRAETRAVLLRQEKVEGQV